jgi:hypothetical protein
VFKSFLQADDFPLGQSAAFPMCLYQGALGSTGSLACGGEADRRSDAADTVQVAKGVRDMLDNASLAAGHAIDADDSILDLAFQRGRKAVPNPGKANFELICVHGALPWVLSGELPRQTLIVSQVLRLIWCVDNFPRSIAVRADRTRRLQCFYASEC